MQQYAARGALHRLPDKIKNAPELRLGLELYYQAFWELDSCRQLGMGAGPIGWLDIEGYGKARGFDEEQLEDLHHFIPTMDAAYSKHWEQKRKTDSGNAQPQPVRAKNAKASRGRGARGR